MSVLLVTLSRVMTSHYCPDCKTRAQVGTLLSHSLCLQHMFKHVTGQQNTRFVKYLKKCNRFLNVPFVNRTLSFAAPSMALLNALRAVRRYLSPLSTSKSWLSTKASLLGDKNILLMGAPGAGKTTVGRIVARRLGLPIIDVDDDVLEAAWKMPVAAKLAAVGGERFLEEEGQALCGFSASGCVVSLTGSNPLHAAAMRRLKDSGVVVYLDVDGEDIVRRLAGMKVNRIVGQEAGASVRDILRRRKPFYEKWLDVRVLCGRGAAAEEVAEKVLEAVERHGDRAADAFVSTRSAGEAPARPKTHFSDVVVEGLAADGGLYVPKRGFPSVDAGEWLRLVDMSYPERASVLLEKCIHPSDVPASDLRAMVFEAYGSNFSSEAVAPVKHLERNQYVQELFHGPTASFKDLALQLMPRLFAHCLPPMCNFLVLVATSGDTGSAALHGFGGLGAGADRRAGVLPGGRRERDPEAPDDGPPGGQRQGRRRAVRL